ncbi:hypothetical protein GGTG_13358 [Gaeumannomyces tritici R3-111a-1]|uniref:VWFA domain-containing protein n=1 Tax=Gaeumannomyces tritici (strain R3-111a-1) TaxID=644352 RepID=J3PIM9_GAET3|nr:hypothetical protein GGTG_13358 [Gaeumannomyces tritici R3-111a-1]EJT69090.1 hypothetical protein GGTG_13358 [Gaeumannomyces tritici R3-111a-1]
MAIKRTVSIHEAGSSSGTDPNTHSSAQNAENHVPQPGGDSARDPNPVPESRPAPATDPEGLEFNVRPLSSAKGLMVRVQPPKAPGGVPADYHVPCDIVLVIDVSASMSSAAVPPVKKGEAGEDHGFNTLDLVKHAALTILATLDERDRLGIVKFSRNAKVVMELLPMVEENKKLAETELLKLAPTLDTVMWNGIAAGFGVFEGKQDGSNRVPAVMLMTDGVPTSIPSSGWVGKLNTIRPFPAPIHTFGFGYSLESGVLKSISELTGGHYAFIPDCGMIGTVFIHAVANLQSTFATEAQLKIDFPATLGLQAAIGKNYQILPVEEMEPGSGQRAKRSRLTVGLGALQFGMSKDLYFEHSGEAAQLEGYLPADQTVAVELSYKTLGGERSTLKLGRDTFRADDPPEAEVAYHVSRSMLCKFLSSLFPYPAGGERQRHGWGEAKTRYEDRTPIDSELAARLCGVKRAMPAWDLAGASEDCASLIQDIEGHEPHGQVALALSRRDYWDRWGGHYLLGLLDAHTRQACNSFKDPGPGRYGLASPLFAARRARLDRAFDAVKPPPPSRVPPPPYRSSSIGNCERRMYSMSDAYLNSSAPCFAGATRVRLAETATTVAIRDLARGMRVHTPLGPRAVAAVLRTRVWRAAVRRVGGVVVTPWHPVRRTGGGGWAFPADMAEARPALYTGSVFSVLLEPDPRPRAHAFLVAESAAGAGSPPVLWGVCLGHGLAGRTRGEADGEEAAEDAGDDVRNHEFWGDYARVAAEMARLPRGGRDGVVLCGGVRRSRVTGRTVGLRKPGLSRGLAKAGKTMVWKLRGRFVRAARSSRKGLISAV